MVKPGEYVVIRAAGRAYADVYGRIAEYIAPARPPFHQVSIAPRGKGKRYKVLYLTASQFEPAVIP